MKTITLVIATCILLALACDTRIDNGFKTFTPDDAAQLVNAYLTALSTGDSTAVGTLWSERSLARRGFWTIHNYFLPWGTMSDWKTTVQGGRFEVETVDREKNHVVLQARWLPQDSLTGQTLSFHVVQEHGNWVFINPIDVITRDWKSYSTEHIAFHYPPEIDISDYMDEIRYAESECARALTIFGLRLQRKIDFYRARTDVECGKLMNFAPVNGFATIPRSAETVGAWDLWFVSSSSFVNHHELIHLIAGLVGIPDQSPAITEGLACAFAGAFHSTRDFIINDARNQIAQAFQYPLRELLTMDSRAFLLNNFITYSQAGSFIRYLHEGYGMRKLIDFCSRPMSEANVIVSLETTYGQPLAQLERDWIEYLLDTPKPEIETTVPLTAKSVFSMGDAEGDDTGDGDYIYPAHRDYPDGCFDLKKFDVLKDESNAYFRLEFNKLKAPLVLGNQPRAEKLVVGVVIAIQKGKGKKRHLQKFCHGVRFADGDGYDCKVNVGTSVSLTNSFGEVTFSSPELVSALLKYETNTIEFSIPLSLMGEPDEAWRYFVGTCLISNRMMNFLGMPMPVHKEPPVPIFISGGNYNHGNPSYMDILLPSGADQVRQLGNYSADRGELAIVPMVGREDHVSKD